MIAYSTDDEPTPPIQIIEEYRCPKCDEVHHQWRKTDQMSTLVECPACGFTRTKK